MDPWGSADLRTIFFAAQTFGGDRDIWMSTR